MFLVGVYICLNFKRNFSHKLKYEDLLENWDLVSNIFNDNILIIYLFKDLKLNYFIT